MNIEAGSIATGSIEAANKTDEGISIIIPVYNGENTLGDTLNSIAQIEYPLKEVIVVDDGSTDRTGAIAESYGARVVRMAQNSGPAAARNQGALHAKYDTLLFTDSDVWVKKSLLHDLLYTFQHANADAVQGTFSEVCPFGNYFSQYKNLYNRFVLNSLPNWIDTTFTSITAVKKNAFMQCGGFDANIRSASVEDRTLGKNLIEHGFRIYFNPSLEVVHNKKLTAWGFIRNQYLRSRDLAKLLLRNSAEPKRKRDSYRPNEENFGTNSQATMARIPVVYLILLILLCIQNEPNLWVGLVFLSAFFLYFIYPFHFYLLKKRGIVFSLKGIPVNFVDAFISGLGVLTGIVEYLCFGKKY